jgi:hypothetical protein
MASGLSRIPTATGHAAALLARKANATAATFTGNRHRTRKEVATSPLHVDPAEVVVISLSKIMALDEVAAFPSTDRLSIR